MKHLNKGTEVKLIIKSESTIRTHLPSDDVVSDVLLFFDIDDTIEIV